MIKQHLNLGPELVVLQLDAVQVVLRGVRPIVRRLGGDAGCGEEDEDESCGGAGGGWVPGWWWERGW